MGGKSRLSLPRGPSVAGGDGRSGRLSEYVYEGPPKSARNAGGATQVSNQVSSVQKHTTVAVAEGGQHTTVIADGSVRLHPAEESDFGLGSFAPASSPTFVPTHPSVSDVGQVSSEAHAAQHTTVADDGSVRLRWTGNMRFWQLEADDTYVFGDRDYAADDGSVVFRWAENYEVCVADNGSLRFCRLDDGSYLHWSRWQYDDREIYVAQHHTTVADDGSVHIWWNEADERWVADNDIRHHTTVAADGSVRFPWAGSVRFWSTDDGFVADDGSGVCFQCSKDDAVYVADDGSLRFRQGGDDMYIAQYHTTVAADGSMRFWWEFCDVQ